MPIRFAASVALLLLSFAPATRAQSAADGPLPVIAADAPSHSYDAGTLRVQVPSSATEGRFSVVELTEQPP